MHRILERQIKRSLGEDAVIPSGWRALLKLISDTYVHFDEDRMLLNRSLEISSKEFLRNNRRLEKTRLKTEKQAKNLALQVAKRTKDLNERVAELEDVRKAMSNLLEDFEDEQRALAKAKAKDEALLNSIGEGMIAVDWDGRVVVINKVAEDLLKVANAKIANKLFAQVISLEDAQGNQILDAQKPENLLSTIASRKIATTVVYYFVRKDGTKFPASITATPVLLDAKSMGTIIVFRDITREKEIEKLRMDFLSLASHQLRTPLSGTKWLIETIQRGVIGKLNAQQKEYIDSIYQINERMIRLVSDMLNVLMLESGVVAVKKENVSVSEIQKELLVMTESASQNKGVVLRNLLKNRRSIALKTDLQILRSILECFVSNAINYSQNGQEVILDAKQESGAVVFFVRDSGIGIPKGEQKRIFERFYRASNSKTLRPSGTGLGLNVARMLAERINAKVSFESEENKGSTFYLRIPKESIGSAKKTKELKI